MQLFNGSGTGSQLGTYTLLAADISAGFANVHTSTLTNGTTYNITARIADTQGDQSAASSAFTVTEDTTAPTGGTPDLISASDSGTSNSDNITKVTSPTFNVALNGTVAVGDTVQLLLSGSPLTHPVTHVITAGDISTGSVNLTVTAGDLGADGSKSISAAFSDAAGNSSTTSALAITLDTTAPTIAINTIPNADVVNHAEAAAGFAISGTASGDDGQTITVKILSGASTADTYTTTASGGTWSVNVTAAQAQALSDGSYTVTADVTDIAGNPATQASHAVTVDETLPTVVYDDHGSDSHDVNVAARQLLHGPLHLQRSPDRFSPSPTTARPSPAACSRPDHGRRHPLHRHLHSPTPAPGHQCHRGASLLSERSTTATLAPPRTTMPS